jgi:hypothetical protein
MGVPSGQKLCGALRDRRQTEAEVVVEERDKNLLLSTLLPLISL